MTHRIVVNVQTGETKIIEYTPEEQAAYDAAVAAQQVAELEAAAIVAQQEAEAQALAAQTQQQPTQ
jgi:hypothetical protein